MVDTKDYFLQLLLVSAYFFTWPAIAYISNMLKGLFGSKFSAVLTVNLSSIAFFVILETEIGIVLIYNCILFLIFPAFGFCLCYYFRN